MSNKPQPIIDVSDSHFSSLVPLSLRVNFSWTFVGNMLYALAQWGMLVVLARLGSQELVGQFALGLAITAPVFMFTNLELKTVLASDVTHKYSFHEYYSLRVNAAIMAMGIVLIIAFFSDYRIETTLVICIVGLSKMFESISNVIYGYMQQQERMNTIGKSLILKSIASIVFFVLGMSITGDNIGATIGLVLVWAGLLLLYDMPSNFALLRKNSPEVTYRIFLPSINILSLKPLIWLTLPLGFTRLMQSLIQTTPRYFTESFLGEAQLGIFAALTYIMLASNRVVLSLAQALTPRLSQYYVNKDYHRFQTLLLKFAGICILFGLAGILGSVILGRPALALIYGAEYSAFADLFVLLMVAGSFSYLVTASQYIMTLAGVLRFQLFMAILVIIVVIVSSLFVIPIYGLEGSVFVVLLANIVYAALSIYSVARIHFRFRYTALLET